MKTRILIILWMFTAAFIMDAVTPHLRVAHAQTMLPSPNCPDLDFMQKWNETGKVANKMGDYWNEFASNANDYLHTVAASPEVKKARMAELDNLWVRYKDASDNLERMWGKVRSHPCF